MTPLEIRERVMAAVNDLPEEERTKQRLKMKMPMTPSFQYRITRTRIKPMSDIDSSIMLREYLA